MDCDSFHFSVKTIGRSLGRTATAAAAYRAACVIEDQRTGEIHDYRDKQGVVSSDLALPPGSPGWAATRGDLWNRAESAERRKNSIVAREFEVSLPAQLSTAQRRRLVLRFATELCNFYGLAVDASIHLPSRSGDQRNHHAHLLCTTRRLTSTGFGKKTRELDCWNTGQVTRLRQRWADLTNEAMGEAGIDLRVSALSLADRGIARLPTRHRGPGAMAEERRTGNSSALRARHAAEADEQRLRLERLQQSEREHDDAAREVRKLQALLAAEIEISEHRASVEATPLSPPEIGSLSDDEELRSMNETFIAFVKKRRYAQGRTEAPQSRVEPSPPRVVRSEADDERVQDGGESVDDPVQRDRERGS